MQVMLLRMMGVNYQQISDEMNAAGISTPAAGGTGTRPNADRLLRTRDAGFQPFDFAALDRRHRTAPPAGLRYSAAGPVETNAQHRNRFFEFIKQSIDSSSEREVATSRTTGLYDRFAAVDTLSNKGAHAAMALEIANLCALSTYILGGEVLRIEAMVRELKQANEQVRDMISGP